jgi:hypothetical protein
MIVFDLPSSNSALLIPQLCVELRCLPDGIRKADYNDIGDILSVLKARDRRAKKDCVK